MTEKKYFKIVESHGSTVSTYCLFSLRQSETPISLAARYRIKEDSLIEEVSVEEFRRWLCRNMRCLRDYDVDDDYEDDDDEYLNID